MLPAFDLLVQALTCLQKLQHVFTKNAWKLIDHCDSCQRRHFGFDLYSCYGCTVTHLCWAKDSLWRQVDSVFWDNWASSFSETRENEAFSHWILSGSPWPPCLESSLQQWAQFTPHALSHYAISWKLFGHLWPVTLWSSRCWHELLA